MNVASLIAASSACPVGTFLRLSPFPTPLGLKGFTGPWAGRVRSSYVALYVKAVDVPVPAISCRLVGSCWMMLVKSKCVLGD